MSPKENSNQYFFFSLKSKFYMCHLCLWSVFRLSLCLSFSPSLLLPHTHTYTLTHTYTHTHTHPHTHTHTHPHPVTHTQVHAHTNIVLERRKEREKDSFPSCHSNLIKILNFYVSWGGNQNTSDIFIFSMFVLKQNLWFGKKMKESKNWFRETATQQTSSCSFSLCPESAASPCRTNQHQLLFNRHTRGE